MLSSPQVKIVFYQETNGACPVLDSLDAASARVRRHALARMQLLAARGHTLRRPHADYLGEDLYELRWHTGRVQYRILYGFHGREAVVLLHLLTKEDIIPRADFARARGRFQQFTANPLAHTRVLS